MVLPDVRETQIGMESWAHEKRAILGLSQFGAVILWANMAFYLRLLPSRSHCAMLRKIVMSLRAVPSKRRSGRRVSQRAPVMCLSGVELRLVDTKCLQ